MACGLDRKDDRLPARILKPLNEGGARGHTPQLDETLNEYYFYRDWDSSGVPLERKIRELGLVNEYEALKLKEL